MVAPCTTLAAQAASGQCFPPAELIDWPLPKSLQQTERHAGQQNRQQRAHHGQGVTERPRVGVRAGLGAVAGLPDGAQLGPVTVADAAVGLGQDFQRFEITAHSQIIGEEGGGGESPERGLGSR
ncbi:hypothetical protein B4Q13_19240 [Lacticaseibacillus rhamnosus]